MANVSDVPSADAVLVAAAQLTQAVVNLHIARGEPIGQPQDFVAAVFQDCLDELTDHANQPAKLSYILKPGG